MKWSSVILTIAVAVATTTSGTMAASGTTYAAGTTAASATIVTTAAPKTTTAAPATTRATTTTDKATTAAPATIITTAAPKTTTAAPATTQATTTTVKATTAAPATIITTAAPKTTTTAPTTTRATTTTVKATTAAPATIITTAAPKTTTTAPATTRATTTTVKATTAAPVTTPATTTTVKATTTTKAPLMPGLHPTGSHSCQLNEIPMGAYQVQKQMPDGSVQMYHYLVCSAASRTYRGPLVGVATTRAATCPANAPLYAGFGAGKGPCAALAAGWKMTTTCKNGDNQGPLPAALPQNYIRYIGCGGIPGDKDYALTQYTTSNSGFREELQSVKCCKVVPV